MELRRRVQQALNRGNDDLGPHMSCARCHVEKFLQEREWSHRTATTHRKNAFPVKERLGPIVIALLE